MPYPQELALVYDHAAAERTGRGVSGIELATDLANICEVLNQVRWFLRRLATADGRWQPSTAVAQTLEDVSETTATAGQTDFPYPGGVTVDPATDLARVYANGVRLPPSQVTLNATTVTIPAQTGGEIVLVELFDDEASVRDDLAQTTANLGASLIGIQDTLATISATTVEGALAELSGEVFQIQQLLGDLTLVIRADGSVDFQNEQSMGGNRLTNVADGVDPQDAVTLSQLQALSSIYFDLGNVFLALSGGIMSGAINMGNNPIVGLQDGVAAQDAVTVSQLNAATGGLLNSFLPLAGGTMTGNINLGDAVRVRNAADPEQPQDYVTLSYLENQLAGVGGGFEQIGGTGQDGNITEAGLVGADFTPLASQIDIDNPVVVANRTLLVSTGPVTITDVLTVERGRNQDGFPTAASSKTLLPPVQVVGGADGDFGDANDFASEGDGGGGWADGTAPNNSQTSDGYRRIFDDPANYEELWRRIGFYRGGRGGGEATGDPNGGRGGGSIIILADGDIVVEGAIDCSGENGTNANVGSWEVGGGGGGSIFLVSRTRIILTGGLLNVKGGNGGLPDNAPPRGGGGGGGFACCIAPVITGDNTNVDDAGGASNAGTAPAGPGLKKVILDSVSISKFIRLAGLA